MRKFFAVVSALLLPSVVCAEWTPLVTSSNFTGLQTDLGTVATGVLVLVVIVLGIGILIRAMIH
jgi:hypothetical protein